MEKVTKKIKLTKEEKKLEVVKNLLLKDGILKNIAHQVYTKSYKIISYEAKNKIKDFLTPRNVKKVYKDFKKIDYTEPYYEEYTSLIDKIADKILFFMEEEDTIRHKKMILERQIRNNNKEKYKEYIPGRYYKLFKDLRQEREKFLNDIKSLIAKNKITNIEDIDSLDTKKDNFTHYIYYNGHLFEWCHETEYDWKYYSKSYNHPKITKTTRLYLFCYPGVNKNLHIYGYRDMIKLGNKLASTAKVAIKNLYLEYKFDPKIKKTYDIIYNDKILSRSEIFDLDDSVTIGNIKKRDDKEVNRYRLLEI